MAAGAWPEASARLEGISGVPRRVTGSYDVFALFAADSPALLNASSTKGVLRPEPDDAAEWVRTGISINFRSGVPLRGGGVALLKGGVALRKGGVCALLGGGVIRPTISGDNFLGISFLVIESSLSCLIVSGRIGIITSHTSGAVPSANGFNSSSNPSRSKEDLDFGKNEGIVSDPFNKACSSIEVDL